MNFIIVFLLPGVVGLKLFMNFNKEKKIFELIIYYLLFVLFSNFLIMLILILLNKGQIDLINYAQSNFVFGFKYMSLSIVLNLFLSFIFTICNKYFTLSIEVENERTQKIKNN